MPHRKFHSDIRQQMLEVVLAMLEDYAIDDIEMVIATVYTAQ